MKKAVILGLDKVDSESAISFLCKGIILSKLDFKVDVFYDAAQEEMDAEKDKHIRENCPNLTLHKLDNYISDECKKYIPNRWAEIIQQDPLLMEIFEEHDYDLEEEAVPPFLFQELRGGNIEHLRPIFALYGQTGLNMLQELLEIDEISKDTAKVELPDEQTSYAGYFFTRFSEDNRQNAENAVQAYIRNINRIFVEEFKEAAPLDENAKIEILFGQAAQTFREEAYQQQINGESTEIETDLIDWCSDMLYKEGYEDIELMTEALYHINCDYLLSDYLQWPMYDTKRENPFRPYFELWKMGLNIYFPERGRVVLIG